MLLQIICKKHGKRERRNEVQEAEKALREEGVRVTAQRALILDIVNASEGHLDAEDIYFEARRRDPKLSLSTVYRPGRLTLPFRSSTSSEELNFLLNFLWKQIHQRPFPPNGRPQLSTGYACIVFCWPLPCCLPLPW